MRIFAISDLHADFALNRLVLEQLSDVEFQRDVLLIAGDIADRFEIIERTLVLLRAKFFQVFYTPGNHELWVRRESYDSIEKFFRILKACERLGVRTEPARMGNLWIVPLFSWYDVRCDSDAEATAAELCGWSDYHFCQWPAEMKSVPEFFLKMNEPRVKSYDGEVISFSHFLPRRDLLPPSAYLRFESLPRVAVCASLETQIRSLKSVTHVFGHSHINCDRSIDGIRYVQNALRYPRERKASVYSLKLIGETAGA